MTNPEKRSRASLLHGLEKPRESVTIDVNGDGQVVFTVGDACMGFEPEDAEKLGREIQRAAIAGKAIQSKR